MFKSRIRSFGHAVPERVITNHDLAKWMETSDEWIVQRSGIHERRWVTEGETLCGLATAASNEALARAKLSADDIDAIIFASLMSDYVFPGTGCLLQQSLGMSQPIPALDVRNQCSGFLYALSLADAWIRSGMYERVLISCAEIHSTGLNVSTAGRDLAVLFGDGAASCIVERTAVDSPHIIDHFLAAQGEYADKLCLREPSPNSHPRLGPETKFTEAFYPHMDGSFVFKNAASKMTKSIVELLERHSLQPSALDFVIAHQANARIIQVVMDALKLPQGKTHLTLDRFGNTTAASIPLTLEEAVRLGKLKSGDLVALTAFGSGFTWGASLLRL